MKAKTINVNKLKKLFIPNCNSIIASDQEKYDLSKSFRKDILFDLSPVQNRNDSIDTKKLIGYSVGLYLSDVEIKQEIKSLTFGEYKDGIGVIFIIEYLNKYTRSGMCYIVFFDISSKNTLMVQEMEAIGGGFGLESYWVKVIENILTDIKMNKYRKWKHDWKKHLKSLSN